MRFPSGVLWLVLLTSACAQAPHRAEPITVLADDLFAHVAAPTPPEDIFALSDPMRAYLHGALAERVRRYGATQGLVQALRDDLRIEYDTAGTRTAAEAFDARAGNCLSLVILTAALARELDLPVRFQAVYGHDTWARTGDLAFLSGHVNLLLGRPQLGRIQHDRQEPALIVDFLPSADLQNLHASVIDESTLVAMYYNNRAAEHLADGDRDAAYAWARAAVLAAPTFTPAYNTLGVIYRRQGALNEARRALAVALDQEPENQRALSNMVEVLAGLGRADDAEAYRQRLKAIEPYAPFYFLDQGLAALQRGELREATQLFRRELTRMPYNHELHFALAATEYRLGDIRSAKRHMTLAMEHSSTRDRRELYAAKLERLTHGSVY
ncbi:MAG TPA: tetratricopeptide repeat protein [Solimonas sp.]